MTYHITAESFGDTIPQNWEEIAAYLNARIEEMDLDSLPEREQRDEIDSLWEAYWAGELPDAPEAVTEGEGESMTKTFRLYGTDGHRQRMSFGPSRDVDFSKYPGGRPVRIHIGNADETGTNEYSLVSITAPDEATILHELWAQISDGLFEDSRVGDVIDNDTGLPVKED